MLERDLPRLTTSYPANIVWHRLIHMRKQGIWHALCDEIQDILDLRYGQFRGARSEWLCTGTMPHTTRR